MAIATSTALLAGAALTAGGSAIAAGKANSAANKAADASVATARENNALTEKIYNQNAGTLSPFLQTGTNAGALLNDFYGIPQATTQSAPTTGALASYGGQTGPNYAGYVNSNPDLMAEFQRVGGQFGNDPAAFGQYHWQTYGQSEGRTVPAYGTQAGAAASANPMGTTQGVTAQPAVSSKSAFADYISNSDYAFQQQEGGNQVNSGYAGAGTVQSGAAMKALERYRQNLQSGYRNQWASGVANQQGVGLSAASALAGVSTNYANTIAASNTAASDARANAALSQQSVFGNALGMAGSGIIKAFG